MGLILPDAFPGGHASAVGTVVAVSHVTAISSYVRHPHANERVHAVQQPVTPSRIQNDLSLRIPSFLCSMSSCTTMSREMAVRDAHRFLLHPPIHRRGQRNGFLGLMIVVVMMRILDVVMWHMYTSRECLINTPLVRVYFVLLVSHSRC